MVVDDHPLFCEALAMTLTSALSVQTITTASCLADGLSKLRAGDTPDAVLLDLNLPDVAGLDGLIRLKAARGWINLSSIPIDFIACFTTDNWSDES